MKEKMIILKVFYQDEYFIAEKITDLRRGA